MGKATKREHPVERPETVDNVSLNTVLYDRFVEKSRALFEQGKEKSKEKGREAWETSMELARQQMAAAGEFTAEQGEVFKGYLRRDLAQTIADMRSLGDEAKVILHPARLGAGAISSLSKLLHVVGDALISISEKTEGALVYEAGEITMAGTLTCLNCGHEHRLTQTSLVPACPKCQGTRFRKGY
jgi:isocitrate dehydrogenase